MNRNYFNTRRIMTLDEFRVFFQAVRNMRQWQRHYFRFKHQSAMLEAKKWEKEVDRIIAEQEQPVLFK